jgi:hypothetical protein
MFPQYRPHAQRLLAQVHHWPAPGRRLRRPHWRHLGRRVQVCRQDSLRQRRQRRRLSCRQLRRRSRRVLPRSRPTAATRASPRAASGATSPHSVPKAEHTGDLRTGVVGSIAARAGNVPPGAPTAAPGQPCPAFNENCNLCINTGRCSYCKEYRLCDKHGDVRRQRGATDGESVLERRTDCDGSNKGDR